ncbi:MAG: adenylate/guanylate cyclase domain-containing protein, partial [Anaerolineales bacterium]
MHQSPTTDAEYKLVTILFADVVGSTELTGRLGAERARVVLDRSLQRMGASVENYGGTVAQFMGDGLLAFFGAPKAHEDDPERAGLAALKMHEAVRQYGAELGEDLRLRVGINTGRVVLGGESETETTATGKPVVLAKRLESSAQPDETLIGETTARLTWHRFELEPLEAFSAKGFDDPVAAIRLQAELAQPKPPKGLAGMHSPLVGRAREHTQLSQIVTELEGGRGCIVTIAGEPGIGKSRLLAETRETHSELPLRWAEGRAYSYTEDQPFSVILDFLSELLDIAPDDAPAMLDLKLETSIRPLLEEYTGEVWPYLASLLGAPIPPEYAEAVEQLDPEALNAKIVNAVVILVEAIADRQPLVLSFEDLHWADHSSLGLIGSLMMATERAPILLIFLLRPDRDKPSWELKIRAETEFAHRYLHLALVPLDESSSRQLVGNLLAITDIPEPVGDLIQSRSEGNPFYVEELLRELIERGVLVQRGETWESTEEIGEVVVPQTLEKVVQARLDRLPPAERSTLQAASVIGRRFPFRVLEAIASANGDLRDHLLRLQQADLVRERARIPELEYIFKHHFVQEVTYGTLLREQCSHLHHQVAETLIALFPERIDELNGTLGRHYAQAGEAELAAEHYEQAAHRAEEIFAYEESAQFLDLALELTSARELTGIRLSRLELLGDMRTTLGENAQAVVAYKEALDLLRPNDIENKWISVRLLRKIGQTIALTEEFEDRKRLDELAKESLKLATDQTAGEPPHPETARVLLAWFLLDVRTFSGKQDWEDAETNAQAALEMAQQLGDPALLSEALAAMEPIYNRRGKIEEQLQIALRRLELTRDPDFRDLRARASALVSAGVAYKNVGNFSEAMPLLEEAYILADEIHAISIQSDALGGQAECWFRQDRWDAVVELDERLLGLHSRYGISRAGPICFSIGFSASVNALRGNADRARELREEAYQIMIAAGGGS